MAAGPVPVPWRRSTLERGEVVLLGLLAVLTVAAWAMTIHQARTMDMPMGVVARGAVAPEPRAAAPNGMDGRAMDTPGRDAMGTASAAGMAGMASLRWSWDAFAAFLVVWAVMMAAMMFPAAAPMLLLVRKIAGARRARGGALIPTWVFAGGYLLVWTVVGAVTWVLVRLGSALSGHLGAADRETWAPIALGATLVGAGLYQFTPLKVGCLRHCQSPVGFVMTRWQDGYRGALRMGVVHGAYCLGCCWALFAVLVAAGVMSLAWMLLLTLVVFAEKVLPLGPRAPQAVGAVFVVFGVLVAGGAAELPWVT